MLFSLHYCYKASSMTQTCDRQLKKGKEFICIAPYLGKPTSKALRCGSNSFYTAKVHHICIYRIVCQGGE